MQDGDVLFPATVLGMAPNVTALSLGVAGQVERLDRSFSNDLPAKRFPD